MKRKADDSEEAFKTPKKAKEAVSLFIGGLSYNTSEEGLQQFFADNEINIASCRIITDRDSGNSRGFGYADFDSQVEADKCYKIEDTTLDGRQLRFDASTESSVFK